MTSFVPSDHFSADQMNTMVRTYLSDLAGLGLSFAFEKDIRELCNGYRQNGLDRDELRYILFLQFLTELGVS